MVVVEVKIEKREVEKVMLWQAKGARAHRS